MRLVGSLGGEDGSTLNVALPLVNFYQFELAVGA